MHKKNTGFSLLELTLVIAVVGMMLLLTLRYFNSSRFNLKITVAVNQIQKISEASYQWLNSRKQLNFSNANNGTPISMAQLLSASLLINSDTQDPWGRNIVVAADNTTPNYVQITLPGASLTACNNLKQRLANTAHSQIANCTTNSGYYGSF